MQAERFYAMWYSLFIYDMPPLQKELFHRDSFWSRINLNLETEKLNIISINNLRIIKWKRKKTVILNCDQRRYVLF